MLHLESQSPIFPLLSLKVLDLKLNERSIENLSGNHNNCNLDEYNFLKVLNSVRRSESQDVAEDI